MRGRIRGARRGSSYRGTGSRCRVAETVDALPAGGNGRGGSAAGLERIDAEVAAITDEQITGWLRLLLATAGYGISSLLRICHGI